MGATFDYTGFTGTYVRALLVNDFGETCTQPFGFKTGAPSGIEAAEAADAATVEIFPNPATDIVNVRATESINIVTLHSMAGAMMMHVDGNSANSLQLDVTALPAGVYLATVATNSSATTLKLIVE